MREEACRPAVVLDDDDPDVVAHATDQLSEFRAEVRALEPPFDALDRTPRLDERRIQLVHGDESVPDAHPASVCGMLSSGACKRRRSRWSPRPRTPSTNDSTASIANALTSAALAANQP